MFKKCKEMLDPITKLTLEIWFTVIRKYNLEKEITFLTFNYDSKFKPGATDSNFKQWINQGITVLCTIIDGGKIKNFLNLKREYDLEVNNQFR